jgi:hypothetical protein
VAATSAALSRLLPTWLLAWRGAKDPARIFFGALRCARARAAAWEWRAARDPVDQSQPDPRVVQRVQGQNPLGFRGYLQVLGEKPQKSSGAGWSRRR